MYNRYVSNSNELKRYCFLLVYLFIHIISYSPYLFCPPSTIQLYHILYLLLTPYIHVDVPTLFHLTSKLPGASSLLRDRCIISEWTQTQKSSTVCELGASYQLVYAVCLVVQCLKILGVQINWGCRSSCRITILLSFFQPSLIQQQGSTASVHWLSGNICIWLFQLLVGSFGKQSW